MCVFFVLPVDHQSDDVKPVVRVLNLCVFSMVILRANGNLTYGNCEHTDPFVLIISEMSNIHTYSYGGNSV